MGCFLCFYFFVEVISLAHARVCLQLGDVFVFLYYNSKKIATLTDNVHQIYSFYLLSKPVLDIVGGP